MTTITLSDGRGAPHDPLIPGQNEPDLDPGTGSQFEPGLLWGGSHAPVSFGAVTPPTLPPKEDPTRKDFYAPPNSARQGLFRWDPVKGHYVLIKIDGREPTGEYPPDDNFVIPEGDSFIQTDESTGGNDGPIWRKDKDSKWVQVGMRVKGKETYFDAKTCSIVNKVNTARGIAPPANENWTNPKTIPAKEDPAHLDMLVPPPPAAPLGRLRWDPNTGAYVRISSFYNGTESPMDQRTFEIEGERLAAMNDEIPKRSSTMKTDWIDDGRIWRLTEGGRVVQVGLVQNGKEVYFNKTTFHTVNGLITKPPAPLTPEQIKALDASVKLTTVTAPPPQAPDVNHPDRDIPLADGKTGVMRWDPKAGRYVFVGTRDANKVVSYFDDAKYVAYNNGSGSTLPKESEERPDYLDSKGIMWRWDATLKKDVQVGWKVGADPGGLLEDSGTEKNAGIRSALNSYNDDPANKLTPLLVNRPLKAPTGEKPADSDPFHPDFVSGLLGATDGVKYVWRWDKDAGRYCAIATDGKYGGFTTDISIDGTHYKRFTDEDYRLKNSGKDGLRFNEGNTQPEDILSIPDQPDPTNADYTEYDWGRACTILYRYDARYGKYVAVSWKPLIGGNYHYFGNGEFRRRNANVIPPMTQ